MIEVKQDKYGFPLIKIPETNIFIHWLPLTKIQIEYFLCETHKVQTFNRKWYDELLAVNNRIAPAQIEITNFVKALCTGIAPNEAKDIASSFGIEYALPSEEEWLGAKHSLVEQPTVNPKNLFSDLELTERAKIVLFKFHKITEPAENLAQQMLLEDDFGILELVQKDGEIGFIGEAHRSLGAPGSPKKIQPLKGSKKKISYIGTRFITKDEKW